MNQKLKFLWIDDDSQRKKFCENLNQMPDVKAMFVNVKNKNLSKELINILSQPIPDLLLIDHRLDKVSSEKILTGSTIAEIIREDWPECPIIGITAVKPKDVELYKKSSYEDLFYHPNLSKPTLLAIVNSFKLLKNNRPKNIGDLIELLKAPEDEKNRLNEIIPEDLKWNHNYNDKSLSITISRWVRHTLMKKPGFLYDRLWSATLLGIKESSFEKVRVHFEKAKYKGIFADESNERWWQAKIRQILHSMLPDDKQSLPWILGHQLAGISNRDYSKCYVCGKEFPETAAFTDETSITRKQMHLRCTIPHPNFKKSLFFEEIRMMKGAE